MAKYGTAQYYKERIDEEKIEKEILLNALQNVARDGKDLHLIENIANKIVDVDNSVSMCQRELERLLEIEKENTEPSEVE